MEKFDNNFYRSSIKNKTIEYATTHWQLIKIEQILGEELFWIDTGYYLHLPNRLSLC